VVDSFQMVIQKQFMVYSKSSAAFRMPDFVLRTRK